ncbi:hypothetical protein N7457_006364 [Penicillium paradoxum]|uniref:uncharacterized protein n=1 Tax=Penicillium paradoxum TaxID=176176 RepID=UPI002549B6B2|nr:uncharacterized protein N7457_006364 [Penicillium paradoxum]KAJ5781204.1 hypothetical protein N7457_006364 [Penicillium paradoxum]
MAISKATDIIYPVSLQRTPSADQAVMDYTTTDSRDIAFAEMRAAPSPAGLTTWHKGGTDPNAPDHLTVDLKGPNGNHITTKHINRDGKAC